MHEPDPALVTARIVQVVQNGRQNVEDVARLENEEQELPVVLTELPEEDQQLLVELDFPLEKKHT